MTSMPECAHHVPFDTECLQCIELKSSRGGGESRPAGATSSSRRYPKLSARDLAADEGGSKPEVASGPREAKRGRPRIEDIDAERRKVLDQLVAEAQELKMGY
jgi:hypothetical protein